MMLGAKSEDVFLQFKANPPALRQNPKAILGLTRTVTQNSPIGQEKLELKENKTLSCRALAQQNRTQFRSRKKARKTLEPHLENRLRSSTCRKTPEAVHASPKRITNNEELQLIERKLLKTEQAEEGGTSIHYSKTEGKMKSNLEPVPKLANPAFEKRFKFLHEKYRHLPRKQLKILQQPRIKTNQDAIAQVVEVQQTPTQENIVESQTPSRLQRTLLRTTHHPNKLKDMLKGNFLKHEMRKRQPANIAISINEVFKERYKVQERIGKGLSGQVYKAHDILADRVVALKVITDSHRKEEEYEFYKSIEHRNIVQYYNNFTHKHTRFLVLQYFPLNLHKLIKRKALSSHQIRYILKNVSSGLLFLHGMSIAHRDIKLDNIVVTEDLSVVKIIDFGLCLDLNSRQSPTVTEVCGTLPYMAPEMLMKKQHHPKKVDIWALGIMLYRLMFDRYPYRGRSERDLLDKIQNYPLTFPPNTNERLLELLRGMLARDPQRRMTMLDIIEHRWLYE